jgi:hypothetical protein
MKGTRDWLDTLARSVGAASGTARNGEEGPDISEEHFSRRTAVKLATAGALSLSVGLLRPDPARAFDLGECQDGCDDATEKWLQRQKQSCADVFFPARLSRLPEWAIILETATIHQTFIAGALLSICLAKEHADSRIIRAGCYADCQKLRQTCRTRQGRSLQGTSSACEVAPPPKNEKPEIPPAPNPDDDLCLQCQGNRGYCCPCGGPLGWVCIEEGACKAGVSCD